MTPLRRVLVAWMIALALIAPACAEAPPSPAAAAHLTRGTPFRTSGRHVVQFGTPAADSPRSPPRPGAPSAAERPSRPFVI